MEMKLFHSASFVRKMTTLLTVAVMAPQERGNTLHYHTNDLYSKSFAGVVDLNRITVQFKRTINQGILGELLIMESSKT